MFTPPPRLSFTVVRDVGRRLLGLNEEIWQGRVEHVDEFELWVMPRTQDGERLLLVGRLPDGHQVVLETTRQLFRAACRELGEEH